jgi:3-oxoadipate enol-lactonase
VNSIISTLKALAEREETCSILGNINIPALVICGREDAITPVAKSEFLNAHIKNSNLAIIENAGHLSSVEKPDEFNKYMRDFLKE